MSQENTPTEAYAELLQFMKNPQSYPHQPEELKHVQTHISHVFIVPPFVYKIKKPVDLGFLDYSSLEKRRKFCKQEVALNRRLCQDVYLGVETICRGEKGLELKENASPAADDVVDYAVKMNKLPEEYFLYRYIEDQTLTSQHLDRVSDALAEFYLSQESSPEEDEKWGSISTIKVNTDENFSQVKPFVGESIEEPSFNAIQEFTEAYYKYHEDLFQQRIREGRIVEGHGDLHLEHIHVSPEQVCIYDCIEFNERFRWGDLASDLAYLAMDLDYKDQPKAEHYFVRQMSGKLKDPHLDKILNFYKCYRAFVKGKVKSLQSRDQQVSEQDRKKADATARKYFHLSLKYALLGSKPKVLLFIGGIGTGKSTLAKKLHETLDIAWFSSDLIRKRMAGVPLTKRTPRDKRGLLYSDKMSDKTYQQLRENARHQLTGRRSAILDATFSNREKRASFIHLLEAREVDYVFIETKAPEQTVRERLRDRDNQQEVISDARLEDYELIQNRYEAPTEIDSSRLISVRTDQSIEGSLEQLYSQLVQWNVQR